MGYLIYFLSSSSLRMPLDLTWRSGVLMLHAPPFGRLPGPWLLGPCLQFDYLRPFKTTYSGLGSAGVRSVLQIGNLYGYFSALVSSS